MPYALIPRDHILKKVTAQQKAAVDAKRSHENVETFLGNETTPLLIGGTMAVALTPVLWALFFKAIEEAGVTMTDVQKGASMGALPAILGTDNVLGAVLGAGTPGKQSLQSIWDTIIKGKGSIGGK